MSVKCQTVIEALERLAPRKLAEAWDNIGLQLGSPTQETAKVLIALDVNEAVVEQAEAKGAKLIVCHHPLIFKPLHKIRTDLPEGRLLQRLIKSDIAVYAAHTNLDIAEGGVNDVLAGRLGLSRLEGLAVSGEDKLCKLTVFVPESHWQKTAEAMTRAGAGHIGQYSNCTFRTRGTGSFLPLEGANPYIGSLGKLEEVEEIRLETILPESISRKVVKAMLAAHPYEEAAYDLYPLNNQGKTYALGRIGMLPQPLQALEFIELVKRALGVSELRVAGVRDKMVRKVALCGGSGASLLAKAAFSGADAYLTGDVKYHEAQSAADAGMLLLDAGHFATEWPVVEKLRVYLASEAQKLKWQLEIEVARQEDVFSCI